MKIYPTTDERVTHLRALSEFAGLQWDRSNRWQAGHYGMGEAAQRARTQATACEAMYDRVIGVRLGDELYGWNCYSEWVR
jgi:hypothetical protein